MPLVVEAYIPGVVTYARLLRQHRGGGFDAVMLLAIIDPIDYPSLLKATAAWGGSLGENGKCDRVAAAPGTAASASPGTDDLIVAIRQALELSDALGHDRIGIALSEALDRARAMTGIAVRDGRAP